MKILLVVKQKKTVETFIATIRVLVERGHSVALAVQEHVDTREAQYRGAVDSPRFSLVRCPAHRVDDWADVARLLRSLRDCAHYQQDAMRNAVKLQARSIQKLREELRVSGDNESVAGALRELPPLQIQRLEAVFGLAERQLPSDPLYDSFLREQAPDVLLLSPLVHFGSAQADFVASARALGIPVGMLLYSWDNLSTKGCLHRPPDWMFVWNERQRAEARALHAFPEDRVVVAGAPRFDAFFELRRRLPREEFHERLGLDPRQPTLLYVCSSQLVSAGEAVFVRKWLAAIRGSAGPLRDCNVIVRPHPDIALLGDEEPFVQIAWPSVRGAKGFVARPFDDPRAIVLKTSDRAQQGLYECLVHSAAVVGLNTSAELEAAIVGTPVYTVFAGDEDADGQSSTLHFHYLLEEQGGCVRSARGLAEHVAQLQAELESPQDRATIRRFAGEFLRPHGIERAVSPLLAEAIERTAAQAGPMETGQSRSPVGVVEAAAAPEVRAASSVVGAGTICSIANERYGYNLHVQATNLRDAERHCRLNKGTLVWLQQLGIGDVVYDIDAGLGIYTLLAAKYHGAVVVAFEPGFASFNALCENVRINGCDGSVIPLPVALADFDGMGELKYPTGLAGWHGHGVKPLPWRVKRSSGEERTVKQPVYAMSLDQVVPRYALPAPHHLRLGNPRTAAQVLAGATGVLKSSTLKTIVFTMPSEESDALAAHLARLDWVVAQHIQLSRKNAHVVLQRAAAGEPVGAATP
ncbi:MAG TPA: hypothetical protein VI485_06890 [Vicinamibacterales bacterium]|nr:hypothetical protein [Vicinamibacterales bacterium]